MSVDATAALFVGTREGAKHFPPSLSDEMQEDLDDNGETEDGFEMIRCPYSGNKLGFGIVIARTTGTRALKLETHSTEIAAAVEKMRALYEEIGCEAEIDLYLLAFNT